MAIDGLDTEGLSVDDVDYIIKNAKMPLDLVLHRYPKDEIPTAFIRDVCQEQGFVGNRNEDVQTEMFRDDRVVTKESVAPGEFMDQFMGFEASPTVGICDFAPGDISRHDVDSDDDLEVSKNLGVSQRDVSQADGSQGLEVSQGLDGSQGLEVSQGLEASQGLEVSQDIEGSQGLEVSQGLEESQELGVSQAPDSFQVSRADYLEYDFTADDVGGLGVRYNSENGVAESVREGSRAQQFGVQVGDELLCLGDVPVFKKAPQYHECDAESDLLPSEGYTITSRFRCLDCWSSKYCLGC